MKINVEMYRGDSLDIKTLLYDGDLYEIKNLGHQYIVSEHATIKYYRLFFMYDDSLVRVISEENFHGRVNRVACNDIYVEGQGDSIFVSYEMFIDDEKHNYSLLIPIDSFMEDMREQGKEMDIQKFTRLYK